MSHDAIYLQKNNIKPYTKPIHTVKSQVTDTNSCQKKVVINIQMQRLSAMLQ